MSQTRKIVVTRAGENRGFCREYFLSVNEKILYCLQEEQRNTPPVAYVCTQDGEPSYKISVTFKIRGV